MKKMTLALSAFALAVNSASALTILDNKDSGTQVDFTGSARLKWTSTSEKQKTAKGTTREHINHAVQNNGSRFGFKVNQQLGNDFYALGRVEWRFRGTARSQHDFDDIYTRQLYAGVGHKKFGELTYGNMTTIADDVCQTDLPNTLSLSDGELATSARRVVQYVYKGVEGLKVGGFYGRSSPRGNNGLDLDSKRKDIWGLASIYEYGINDQQSATFGLGTTRERHDNGNRKTAYTFGTSYTFDKTTIGLDLDRAVTKNLVGDKATKNRITTVVYQAVTDRLNAYTMYAYNVEKDKAANAKEKKHQFMIGAEYYIVPKYLKTFVEWQATRGRTYEAGVKTAISRNYTTVVGLRAYW